ncbi:hypothetical protein ANCCAN_04788, partial [Ancylostoma caninum]
LQLQIIINSSELPPLEELARDCRRAYFESSTVYRWLHSNGWPPKRKVLFLGGYTADGRYYSLETITLLFALKKQMPNHVYLLRGASEVYPVNIEGRFSRRVTRCLEGVIQRACGYLPLAATVADTIFCCHGGITPRMTKLSDITDIRRPIHHVRKGTIAADLIFSVVAKNAGLIPGARGRRFNPMCDETELVLRALGMEMLVRSRNPLKQGYQAVTRNDERSHRVASCAFRKMFMTPLRHRRFSTGARSRHKNVFIVLISTDLQSFGARTLSIWSAPGESGCKAGAAIHVNCSKVLTIVKMAEYGTFTKDQLESVQHERVTEALLPMNKDRERRRRKAKTRTDARKPDIVGSPNRET